MMQCADWIIASFMRYVMQGASTGRGLLDAKQEFVRWINQQGRNPDVGEEKTLLQFHLLGDPSIHPVTAQGEIAALAEGDATTAPIATASLAFERRRRRTFRKAMGAELRKTIPSREVVSDSETVDSQRLTAATEHLSESLKDFNFDDKPMVHRVVATLAGSEAGMERAVAASMGTAVAHAPVAADETLQYYWTARKPSERVVDACMLKVETNREGEILRTQVLVTS